MRARGTASAGMTSQRVDSDEHPVGLLDFLRRHDASVQVLVTMFGHAYGASPPEVFLLTRAAVHSTWAELGALDENARILEMGLLLTRTARSLGGHAAPSTHRPRPTLPPAPRSVLAARSFEPGWRHPDPWRLLAADEARPLRALRHLDPLARDLAVLRWLGVPGDRAAPELGLPVPGFAGRLDDAMRQWAAVVAAADPGTADR
ncbi:hypothetical protein LQ327_16330 [Actinomycetospora endophytica]|uniref:DNA-directed RNA polymerase specialized sigma24 family protein n=1 Tax=Actinomycetospora endophytica TaxID=2291215 RepID=A0ABS8P9J7_9PSEU|nr:hypothetical protein [Actinomycetospora endophytica]MCD2194941.1 hypothetical protein [Actinomycetospora endophytica]